MDPMFSIDLTSIAGIVGVTFALVELIKRGLAKVPALNCVPIWIYSLAVAAGLTYVAHDLLYVLDGNLRELIVQAVMASLMASGAFEQGRTLNKPLGASTAARAAKGRGLYLLPILLAVGLSASACASTGTVLVEIDRGIHATVTSVDDIGNAACDAKLRSAADCQAFNAALVSSYTAYENFNRGVREGSVAAGPAMVAALAELRAAALSVTPQAEALLADLQALYDRLHTRPRCAVRRRRRPQGPRKNARRSIEMINHTEG